MFIKINTNVDLVINDLMSKIGLDLEENTCSKLKVPYIREFVSPQR